MANLPETPTYDAGVFQLEVDTPALGGPAGPDNAAAINLANRTAYLKQHVDNLESGATIPPTVAPKNSPALTGTPTSPTAALGDDSTKVATTAFVKDVIGAVLTKSVAGASNVTLTADEAGHAIIVCTGAITANIALLLPVSEGDWVIRNATTGNYTLTVRRVAGGTGVPVARNTSMHLWADANDIRRVDHAAPNYESAGLTITAGVANTVAHGLGVTPSRVDIRLRCVTADGTFSVGDEIPISDLYYNSQTFYLDGAPSFGVRLNSTNVTVHNNGIFGVVPAHTIITISKWVMIIRAWI